MGGSSCGSRVEHTLNSVGRGHATQRRGWQSGLPSASMITSVRNPRVAEAVKLRKRALRDKRRLFLVEGAQAIAEAVAARPSPLRELFAGPDSSLHPAVVAAGQAGIPVVDVSDEVIRALTSTVTPQGLVGVAEMVDVGLDDLPPDLSLGVVLFAV